MGEEGIVAARSLVTRDGRRRSGRRHPRRSIREGRGASRHGQEPDHIRLADVAFQRERAGRGRLLAAVV